MPVANPILIRTFELYNDAILSLNSVSKKTQQFSRFGFSADFMV